MAPVNVALLGSGIFASTAYLPALKAATASSTVNLHSLWSRSEKSVTSLSSDVSFASPKTYFGDSGLDEVLADKEIDAVLIVLPITKQPDIVRKAWKAGKHVLSEKPLHKDIKHAKELVEEYENQWKPKGLIWRVAENFAHEPTLRAAADILANTPDLGPVLYWSLTADTHVEDGSKYQATSWRTIPDYQGGFLLDGGVHWAAVLRTVLPPSARPASIISTASLHRTHLLPHDTILGLALPAELTAAHGSKTKLTSAAHSESDIPGEIGQSGPHGQISLSFALPDVQDEGKRPSGLVVVLLNGVLKIEMPVGKREWHLTLSPAKDSKVQPVTQTAKPEGVEVEVAHFGQAVAAAKEGKTDTEQNHGEPRGALWDLAVLEALLKSGGNPLKLDELLS